jgi:hypothetical protein
MTWKNLKKILTITKKRLLHRKIGRFTLSTNVHYFKKIAFVAIIILSVIVLSTVTVDLGLNKSFVQANTIQGIGVGIYWNQNCTNRTLSLNWGSTEVGSSSNLTIYIRNEGNSEVSLRLNASKWIPSNAQSYMSLNWNYTNQVLNADEVIPIELTLAVSPTICDINNFSFDVTVTTIGAQ